MYETIALILQLKGFERGQKGVSGTHCPAMYQKMAKKKKTTR